MFFRRKGAKEWGKDRAEAGGELHTNFQLSGAGEFLALVKPDGVTVAHGFAPEFPEQYEVIAGIGFALYRQRRIRKK